MDVIVWIPKTRAGGSLLAPPKEQRRNDDFACDGKKRNVLGEPVQTFQDAMCKPSAQPRYVAVFTVLHFPALVSVRQCAREEPAGVRYSQKCCSQSQTQLLLLCIL